MAVNLASRYDKKVIQPYVIGTSLTQAAGNRNYEFSGVKTVTVYTLTSQALADYTRTGTARFGTPTELQDTKQDFSVTKDRAFSITVDDGNNNEQMMVKETGKVIKMQLEQEYIPEVDTYRLSVMSAAAVSNGATASTAITTDNAYEMFLNGNGRLDDKKVPVKGRVCFVTAAYYNILKRDDSFVKASDMGQKMLITGQVGEVDGVAIVKVPSSYVPAGVKFLIAHPSATVFVDKTDKINTHINPPGIGGNLIEGRFIYDAIVSDTRKDGLYVHKVAVSA